MEAFEREVRREELSLVRACLILSRDLRPGLDVAAHLRQLDDYARRVDALRDDLGFPKAASRVLFVEEGFRGAPNDYYDPANALLDRVLERKRGMPITLSIVWLEVARKLGEPLVGIAMPGHFIVAYEGQPLDPFRGGIPLSPKDCQGILDGIYGGRVRFDERLLAAASDRDILARVLLNLKNAFIREGDAPRALWVEDRMLELNPYAFEEYRERGLLRRQLGDPDGARADLRRYLESMPGAPDAERIRRLIWLSS